MRQPTQAETLNIEDTIAALRCRTQAHDQVISNFEAYSRHIAGTIGADDESLTGRANGYTSEIAYLKGRMMALEELIRSVERYQNTAIPKFPFIQAA